MTRQRHLVVVNFAGRFIVQFSDALGRSLVFIARNVCPRGRRWARRRPLLLLAARLDNLQLVLRLVPFVARRRGGPILVLVDLSPRPLVAGS